MGIKVSVGYSEEKNPQKAGRSAAEEALRELGEAELMIVFSSVELDQRKMLAGVMEVSAKAAVTGCSDAGQIITEGPRNGGVAVMAIQSDTVDFFVGSGGKIAPNVKVAGEKLAKDILSKTEEKIKALVIFTDVLSGNGADVVRGVQAVVGKKFLIMGGAAGDDFKFKETFVYCNGEVLPSSLAGFGISGNLSLGFGVRHGWNPVGLPVEVTKSDGAVIKEIDGKPAISIYEDYFGPKASEIKEEPLAVMAITYPLGMDEREYEELLIRDPITVDEKGAITCAAEIPEGSTVRLMIGSKEDAIEAARKAAQAAKEQLNGRDPRAGIIFNCIARNKLFGRDAYREIKAVKSVIGEDVPLIGFYTYGEIAPLGEGKDKGVSRFHNETFAILLLSD